MNRTELAEAVSVQTGLDRRHAEAAVEAVAGSIIAEVRAGQRVSIFGFGTFDPRTRAARVARNPQTQATVRVPASKTVAFKPAAAFKDALNSKGKTAPAKKAAPARAGAAKKGSAKKAAAKSAPARAAKAAKKR